MTKQNVNYVHMNKASRCKLLEISGEKKSMQVRSGSWKRRESVLDDDDDDDDDEAKDELENKVKNNKISSSDEEGVVEGLCFALIRTYI